jgi:hypothetical protein
MKTTDMAQMQELVARMYQENNEPLHPDLLPFFEEEGVLGAQLRHPLVYQVPFFSNGNANAFYEQKKKGIEEALKEKNYNRFIFLYERPYRLQAFMLIADLLSDTEYWSLLSSVWIDTENQWQHLKDWKKLLGSKRSNRHYMMSEEEDNAVRSLSDEVVVYRGCQKGLNENGLSWSLDKSKAEFFANRFGKKGIILEKKISKQQIIAVLTGRGEAEVIFSDTTKGLD